MSDSSEPDRPSEEETTFRRRPRSSSEAEASPIFNPKGIRSNVLLAAATAVVPMIIIGIAGVKGVLGARKSRR